MTKHRTGTRNEWLAERLELVKGGKEHTQEGDEPARGGGRLSGGSGSTSRIDSTPTRGAPRWRTSSGGARSSSSTTTCSGPSTRRGVPPAPPSLHAVGGVAGAARQARGVQAADGLELSLGVLVRRRLQRRLQRLLHRGAAANRSDRIQLRARRPRDGRHGDPADRRRQRGDGRHRRGHLHARAAGHERLRAGGRRRLPHLLHLRARAGRPLGHVPVARPRSEGAQRDGHVVAPARRVRQAMSEALDAAGATGTPELSQRMVTGRASQGAFFAVSALLFAAGAGVTIARCRAMSAMGGMPMPGGWTMSMAWLRMPGQTWPGAAAAFLGGWVVMMVAMMLPSLVPMLRRYRRAVGTRDGS